MKCTKCGKDKPASAFRRNKNFVRNNYRSYWCKECDLKGKRTPEGRLVIMYNSTRTASRTRRADAPDYTFEAFSKWCRSNGYMKHYNKWVKSDYSKDMVPSVDRIDPKKPYTFSNIQILPWSHNHGRNVTEMSFGVTRYDLNGRNPKKFSSVRAAARSISPTNSGGGIIRAINEERSIYGFLWKRTKG